MSEVTPPLHTHLPGLHKDQLTLPILRLCLDRNNYNFFPRSLQVGTEAGYKTEPS
jgi:hypothetical protein